MLVVDAKSKWIEVFPMSSTTASTTIRALRFLFATHGLPEVIVSDNGSQFVVQETKEFLKSNGIRHCLSSPYHPASNGEVERAIRTFKESTKTMKMSLEPKQTNWHVSFWVIGQLLIQLLDAPLQDSWWVVEFAPGWTFCVLICRLECPRKLSLETISHVVTFYLVTQSWLEIIGIVSDRGSKESFKIA